MERKVPEKIKMQLRKTNQQAFWLRLVHALLSISSIVCSLLVAAKINSFEPVLIEWLAFMAAASVGIMSGFDLGSKANRMRRAWRRLNAAIIEFEEDSNTTIEELIEAYKDAEQIIGDVKEKPR